MTYQKEKEMYPEVQKWLEKLLKTKYKNKLIHVYDTHAQNLSSFLVEKKLHDFFPDYPSYEIKVDVTGVLREGNKAALAFVECKLQPITLRDISQLLGYSRVAKPLHSIILSPRDVSSSISYLFRTLRRYDVLYYDKEKKITIGMWSRGRKSIIPSSIIPKGEYL